MVSFYVKLALIQGSCQGQEFLAGRHLNTADGAVFDEDSCPTYALTSRRRRRPLSDPCPNGFTTIQDEAACQEAQSCLGYKWQGKVDSTIDNADRQHACVWMRRGGGTVWFNPNVDDGQAHWKVQRLCRSDDATVPTTVPTTAPTTAPSTSCEDALDLAGLVSPINDTTVGRQDTLKNWNNLYGAPERVFYYDLAPGYSLTIGQTINNFDSTHVTRWGGSCPGTNVVVWSDHQEGTDDHDDEAHTWVNDQRQTESVYFVVDGYDSEESGEFTLAWSVQEVLPPRAHSCDAALDLAGLVSPIDDTTVGRADSLENYDGLYGLPERVFYLDLAPGSTLTIGQTYNNFDSTHATRWGGPCPGTNIVEGTDDGDLQTHSWVNDQAQIERVYFIVDGLVNQDGDSETGDFTLAWSVQEAP